MPLIDVVIPVYLGYENVRQCIASILKFPQQNPFELVVVDDASPERKISEYLDRLAEDDEGITLIRNKENRGFVASVNKGMSKHPDRDVLLLNSDTIVANNWLDRLCRCAYEFENVGTVTPFSNDATICSFPDFCRKNNLLPGIDLEGLDNVFLKANQHISVEIPTAVGFCMYIRRSCIEDVGLFDEKNFGQGYGEENDFCMRASATGWHHRLCCDTFVFHIGGDSFGDEKDERVAVAMEKLDRLYPKYHQLIHSHISKNPARALRVNAMIHLIRRSDKQTVLFVIHQRGGGAEKHIQELARSYKERMDAVVIRPGGNGHVIMSLGLEKESESLCFDLPSDYADLIKICKFLFVSRVHFHHTMGITPYLWAIHMDLDVPHDVTLHDYYFINANPTLIDMEGRFCEERGSRDELCKMAYPIPGNVTAKKWRENQFTLLGSADRVFSPSQFTANLYRDYFQDLNYVIAYHNDWEKDAPYPPLKLTPLGSNESIRIVVLGALSREKGADVLESCAKISKNGEYPLIFHLIGYAYRPLDPSVIQYGPYHDDQLLTLISDVTPHLIWFPAQWPETYSYTLSAALRTGLPVAAPDLGAFTERLAGRPYSWVLDWKYSAEQWVKFFLSLSRALSDNGNASRDVEWKGQPEPGEQAFTYGGKYLVPYNRNLQKKDLGIDVQWVKKFLNRAATNEKGKSKLTRPEQVLMSLLKIRELRIASPVLKLVPFRAQRFVKRVFSPRPVHELLLRDRKSGDSKDED